ncbi:hypothetical protein [Geitlerinema sp. PCC 9228]|uniref:hypothetical protein n=1 Tax=Geitlerinema sp. PCC 9228 TaxID=111611 RepID=UPI001114CA57|nr:hypothetical protein [Geitlerinema sp. PCC 9228]
MVALPLLGFRRNPILLNHKHNPNRPPLQGGQQGVLTRWHFSGLPSTDLVSFIQSKLFFVFLFFNWDIQVKNRQLNIDGFPTRHGKIEK